MLAAALLLATGLIDGGGRAWGQAGGEPGVADSDDLVLPRLDLEAIAADSQGDNALGLSLLFADVSQQRLIFSVGPDPRLIPPGADGVTDLPLGREIHLWVASPQRVHVSAYVAFLRPGYRYTHLSRVDRLLDAVIDTNWFGVIPLAEPSGYACVVLWDVSVQLPAVTPLVTAGRDFRQVLAIADRWTGGAPWIPLCRAYRFVDETGAPLFPVAGATPPPRLIRPATGPRGGAPTVVP